MDKIEFVATTLLGVEAITARECEKLGFEDIKVEDGKVFFSGDLETLCLANLWLRTAERVLIKLGEFTATTFTELFDNVNKLPLENWIPKDGYFPIKAYSIKSDLHSVPDCQSIVKKAIVERLKSVYNVDWLEDSAGIYKIHLSLMKNRAILMLDTSGEGLHKRGYREESNVAPIKETLASAILLLSYWNPNKPLRDPTCGSGTFLIEAAMIGKNKAPGLNRHFAFETWDKVSSELFQEIKELARNLEKKDITLNIKGSDIDRECVELTKKNAKIAGVNDLIEVKQQNVLEFDTDEDYGVVVCNPPYGERISNVKEAERLYKGMGKVFSRFKTWSYYIITSDENFEKVYGRQANKKRKLYNGMIKCNLYQFFGEKPPRK